MNSSPEEDIKKALWILIGITGIVRLWIAATLELSVDEVYYWTYALYPDWSHFDHPPMVGFIIQLFSLNLLFDSEIALRLGAVVLAALNTFIIFQIGKSIKNSMTGLYAAYLFNASVYCSVLAGNFILPDTPQLFFWLLSLYLLLVVLPTNPKAKGSGVRMLLAGLTIGLSVYSKYHGVFIWVGAGLYILMYNRDWLKSPALYGAALISVAFTVPIIIWNIQNDWISFAFHGDRVTNRVGIRLDYFFTELVGQVAYNNPVNYVFIIMAIIAFAKGKQFLKPETGRILLLNALPLWAVFTSFSLFRQTLPHWSAPAFTPLILLVAAYLDEKAMLSYPKYLEKLVPKVIRYALGLLYGLLVVAWLLINFYPGTIGRTDTFSKYGDTDFTLDMYGWDQIKDGFEAIAKRDRLSGLMADNAPIICPKYFPGTEIDYYVARPLGMTLLQYGNLKDIHKYAWINESRAQPLPGDDAYMITTSNWYSDPYKIYVDNFESIVPTDTITISRSGQTAYYAFVYRMINYRGNFISPLQQSPS